MRSRSSRGAAIATALAIALPAQGEPAKAREALVEQLASADATARSRAYQDLMRARGPELVALLGRRIEALPADGQRFALYLLQQHPIAETRAVYTKLLTAERAVLRAGAAAMLARHGDDKHLGVLAKAIAAAPSADRTDVLSMLWSIDDPTVQDAVRTYVAADSPVHVVVSALQRLRQQEKAPSAATAAAVRQLAAAPGADHRAAALAWLAGGADGEAAAKELAALLQEHGNLFATVERLFERDRKYPAVLADAFVQALAGARSAYQVTERTQLVRAQAPERLAPTLQQLLDHEADDVRTAAVAALATVPGGLDGKELQRLLHAGTPEQQLAAALVLRRRDDPAGLPTVLALVHKPGKHLPEAVRVLATFRSRDCVEPLLAALDDDNPSVRQNAWTGLQPLLRDLFPYRRFDFARAGYDPNAADRTTGLQALRTWWAAAR